MPICEWCKNPFPQIVGKGRPKKFCSDRCRNYNWRGVVPVCRCGRDYLTVPLEDSHECIKMGSKSPKEGGIC